MHDAHIGMDRATFAGYSDAGLLAELRTVSPKGKLLTHATTAVSYLEVTACVPGANGRGPSCQWVSLFEMLALGGVGANGARLLSPDTVATFTARHRVGMYDIVQGMLCDWTLGLFVGSPITGPHASAETYGHAGSQSSMGFVDPKTKLAAVIVCNTRPGPKAHAERMRRLSAAVYEDFGLAVRENAGGDCSAAPPMGGECSSAHCMDQGSGSSGIDSCVISSPARAPSTQQAQHLDSR